jgi:hypothetical protein
VDAFPSHCVKELWAQAPLKRGMASLISEEFNSPKCGDLLLWWGQSERSGLRAREQGFPGHPIHSPVASWCVLLLLNAQGPAFELLLHLQHPSQVTPTQYLPPGLRLQRRCMWHNSSISFSLRKNQRLVTGFLKGPAVDPNVTSCQRTLQTLFGVSHLEAFPAQTSPRPCRW